MATPRPLESSPSTLPFSIENILRGRDRKSIGSPHSAFRRCAKNGISQPVADQISVPFCIERFEVTDPAVSGTYVCRHCCIDARTDECPVSRNSAI